LEIEWHSDLYFLVFKVLQLLADNEIFAPLLLHLEAQECSIADLILKNFSHRLDVYTKISDLTSNTVPIAPRIIQTLLPGIGEGTKQANTTLADEGKSEKDLETSDSLMLFMKLVVDKVRLATQILGSERNVSKGFLSDFSSTVSGIRRNIGEILKIGDDSRDLVSEYAGKSDSGGNGSSSSSSSSSSNSSSTSNDNEAEYKAKMLPLQYGENDVLSSYHYRANLLTSNMGSNVKSRVKRLAQEHSDLSHSLPVSLSSSVWLRCSAERMDAVQFMISGPEDTPYSNGLFLFDSFFPENYPQHAPKVNLQTTGRGTVRFNPNLYNCGKVCLSLLGTWPGQTEEGWVASNSTFLQVIVSIQSLILVPDPYFNEPGYEGTMGSSNGQKASEAYNLNLREQTIRWGMIDVLTNPPTGFEEIIRTHFKLKRECIIELVEKWESLAPKSKRETFTSLKSTLISAIAHL
jgi:ubiquitin-protein ligase